MKSKDNNTQAFLALVRAGLWEREVQLSAFGDVDYAEVYRLAEEQSVVGLVAAGIEHIIDVKVPQNIALSFVGAAMQLEQRNIEMNTFLESLYGKMQKLDMYSILVKGQGIAQCYERPLWRAAGDIDLLLSDSNYDKTKDWLQSVGQICIEENSYRRRIEFNVKGFDVELHGTMRGELGRRIDKVIDEVQRNIFYDGNVRSCLFGKTTVFLPAPDNDVIFIFTHILQHFFRGGIGLRQICDWCRLLWTYKESIDVKLLEKRLCEMGVMTEWKAFAALAVDILGMPVEAIPLYSTNRKWKRKSKGIIDYIMRVGNFGHNRDSSYRSKHTFLIRKIISFSRQIKESFYLVRIFPIDTVKTLCSYFVMGTIQMINEKKGWV